MRVLVILSDGLRPDAIKDYPKAQKFIQNSTYTLNAETVMPSVTLPCHMSLFHSVDPSRHGTTTNTFTPQVRPIDGLCEVIADNKMKSAFFYNWGELRDLAKPASLVFSYFCKGKEIGYDKANNMVTDAAIEFLSENYTEFAFLYLGYTDMAGHKYGWMSKEYMEAVDNSFDNIERVISALPDDYTFIITSDHGGHDRTHGSELPDDMTIPILFIGKDFEKNKIIENVTIKDIAPTVTRLLGIEENEEWEGKSII